MAPLGFFKKRWARKVWPMETPRRSRPECSYSVAAKVDYSLRRMSTKETMLRCPCDCDFCVECIRKGTQRRGDPEVFAPSWGCSTYCTPIDYRKVKGDPKMSYEGIKKAYKTTCPRKPINYARFLRLVTYVNPIVKYEYHPGTYDELIQLCCCLYDVDLPKTMAPYGDQMATDLLRRVLMLFTQTWQALTSGDGRAECSAYQMRRFLTHVLSFPMMTARLYETVTNAGYFPFVTPVEIFEILVERYLFCTATAALLCNVTRNDKMAQFLVRNTQFLERLRNNSRFPEALAKRDDLGSLLLHLVANLAPFGEFPKFLIDHNSGYIMNMVVLPLIAVPSISSPDETIVWALLRNFVMLKIGREYVINNLDVLLGWLLLPIAGGEDLSFCKNAALPKQLKKLSAKKERVNDGIVREMILDIFFSLCRYKKDRELLREKGAHHILKFYQIAEEAADNDFRLIEKVKIVAGFMNDEQRTSNGNDDLQCADLWHNDLWQDIYSWAVFCGPIKVRGTILFR